MADHDRTTRRAEAQAAPQPMIWSVPVRRRPGLRGRAPLIRRVEEGHARGHGLQILRGIPGVGKTQIAVHYAHQRAWIQGNAKFVWWVDWQTSGSRALVAFARALRLGPEDETEILLMNRLMTWLTTNDNWLIVVDGAGSPEHVLGALPDKDSGQVLVTTTDPQWNNYGLTLPVRPLTPHQAATIFAGHRASDSTERRELATQLGCLPLALQQARAYMTATGQTCGGYQRLLDLHTRRTLAAPPLPDDYPRSVDAVIGIAIAAACEMDDRSAMLLNIAAHLAANDLPLRELVSKWRPGLREDLRPLVANEADFDSALAPLIRYGLLELEEASLSIHPLTQLVVRSRQDGSHWLRVTIDLLSEAVPDDLFEPKAAAGFDPFVPHIIEAGRRDPPPGVEDAVARLVDRAATRLQHRGDHEWAAEAFEVAATLARAADSTDLQLTIQMNYGLAVAHLRPQEGLALLEEALETAEGLFPNDAGRLATFRTNIGWAYHQAGDSAAAEPELLEALSLYNQSSAAAPPRRGHVHALMNLGLVLYALGRYPEALEATEHAGDLLNRTDGDTLGDAATIANNIAAMERAMNDLDSAIVHYRQALQQRTDTLGSDHRLVYLVMSNLAAALADLGKRDNAIAPVKEAIQLHQAARRRQESRYPGDDADLALIIHNIGLDRLAEGVVLRDTGHPRRAHASFELAESLIREAWAMRCRIGMTEPHARIAESIEATGRLMVEVGRSDEANTFLLKTLEMRRTLKHSPLALSEVHHLLARTAELAGDIPRACRHLQQALEQLAASGEPNLAARSLASDVTTTQKRLGCSL